MTETDAGSFEKRFDAEAIASRLSDVAGRIDADFQGRPLVLLSILKGGALFSADLSRRIRTPLSLAYISVRRAESGDEPLRIDFATGFDVAGKPVVLVKDVVNTGVIETYLSDQL